MEDGPQFIRLTCGQGRFEGAGESAGIRRASTPDGAFVTPHRAPGAFLEGARHEQRFPARNPANTGARAKKKVNRTRLAFCRWCRWTDSNCRPSHYESGEK
jgi:hypothetical protein